MAREFHARGALGQVGVWPGQAGNDGVAPVRPGALVQGLARLGVVAQGLVVGQHGGASQLRAHVQALVTGIDVAQRARVGVLVEHVVPRRGGAGAVAQRCAQVDVGHQPRRPLQALRHLAHKVWRVHQHPRCHKHRQRHHGAWCLPALQALRGVYIGIHLHAMAVFCDAQHAHPGVQAALRLHGLGQALRQPAVAFGPGEHAFALALGLARGMKAVAAGEVVNARPGRDAAAVGAEVVSAAVIQVPAQVAVVQALLVQPRFKSKSI